MRAQLTPNPSMQSLRSILIRFPKSHSFSSLRSISSSIFLNHGWEEETRALRHPDRNPSPIPQSPLDLVPPSPQFPSEPEMPRDPEEPEVKPDVKPEVKPKFKAVGKVRVSAMGRKKVVRAKVSWVCENCGETIGQWWGICPSCKSEGTLKQFSEGEISRARGVEVSEASVRSWLPQKAGDLVPQSLKEVNKGREQSEWRIPL